MSFFVCSVSSFYPPWIRFLQLDHLIMSYIHVVHIYIFCVWDERKLSNNQIILSKKEGKRRDCNNIIYKQLNLWQQQLSISLIQSSSTACMVLINSVNKKLPQVWLPHFFSLPFYPSQTVYQYFPFSFAAPIGPVADASLSYKSYQFSVS